MSSSRAGRIPLSLPCLLVSLFTGVASAVTAVSVVSLSLTGLFFLIFRQAAHGHVLRQTGQPLEAMA